MEKEELDKGMKDAKEKKGETKDGKDSGDGADASQWSPNIDWVMQSMGPFFNNNRGIGELLLDKINEAGINTEGVALAGMVNVLQQFSREYKMLGEALGNNIERVNELSDQSEDLAQAVKDLIRDMGVSEEEGAKIPADDGGGVLPGMGAGAPPDMGGVPPDMGAGAPLDMGVGAPPDMGGVPPDMGAGVPPDMGTGAPPDMGGVPPDMGAGAPPDMGGVPSDEGIKDVKRGVLSDARLKRAARRMVASWKQSSGRRKFPAGMIDACLRRD